MKMWFFSFKKFTASPIPAPVRPVSSVEAVDFFRKDIYFRDF